jgi:Uncharacterised nucleotidyltransferase
LKPASDASHREGPRLNLAQERLLELLSYGSSHDKGDTTESVRRRASWTEGDWSAIAAEAFRHELGPLLHDRLETRLPDQVVPPTVAADLRNTYRRSAVAALLRSHLLARVLGALNEAGIETIILKGAYLAENFYGNPALRPMSDVDILVHPEDLGKANLALSSVGFNAMEFSLSPPDDVNEFHYVEKASGMLIEVHWALLPPDYPFTVDMNALWKRAIPARVAGAKVLALSSEDLVIHLAIHATIHRFEFGLRPLCDLAEVLSWASVDWEVLEERTHRNGMSRAVLVPLSLAGSLLQAAIPRERMAGPGTTNALPEGLWEEARETVLLNSDGTGQAGRPNPNFVLFMGRARWRDKLRLLTPRVFPSRKMIGALYPVPVNSLRVFLYYPLSIWALLKRNKAGLGTLLPRAGRIPEAHRNAAALMDWMLTPEKSRSASA